MILHWTSEEVAYLRAQWPTPAPTGVIDYALRFPDGADHLSTLAEIDTRGEGS